MSVKITVNKSSNVYKAVPDVWHTVTSKGSKIKETVTCRISKSYDSSMWTTIEKAKNYHWLQVRDPEGLRQFIKDKYSDLFTKVIPEDDLLIFDLTQAEMEIFPRTFRCPKCSTLTHIKTDWLLRDEVIASRKDPKIGIECPACGSKPMSQQPHIIIDYQTGRTKEIPTLCPLCGDRLKLEFRGSAVSIMGWRLSCTNSVCSLSITPLDPYARDSKDDPIFVDFFDGKRMLSITPTTRGPARSLVETKIDTAPFHFKPNECVLASLFSVDGSPSMIELKGLREKIREGTARAMADFTGTSFEECLVNAENVGLGNKAYDQAHAELLAKDPQYKQVSEAADDSGKKLRALLVEVTSDPTSLDTLLAKLREEGEEPINLLFAQGIEYEEFAASLRDDDPRKSTGVERVKKSKSILSIDTIRYLYPSEVKRTSKEIGGFQIVKASLGIDVGLSGEPRRRKFADIIDKNGTLKNGNQAKGSETHPIIFATNHPIEGLFIRVNPRCLQEREFLRDTPTDNPRMNMALSALADEKEKDKTKTKTYVLETMLHTLSHLLMRRLSEVSGLSAGSLSHKIYPFDGSILIYTTVYPTLGQLEEVFKGNMEELINYVELEKKAMNCPRDPICLESMMDKGSCFACLHIPEYSCDHYWNKQLDRRILWSHIPGVKGLWN